MRKHHSKEMFFPRIDCSDVLHTWPCGRMFIEKSICNSKRFMAERVKRCFLHFNGTGMLYSVKGKKLSPANVVKTGKGLKRAQRATICAYGTLLDFWIFMFAGKLSCAKSDGSGVHESNVGLLGTVKCSTGDLDSIQKAISSWDSDEKPKTRHQKPAHTVMTRS